MSIKAIRLRNFRGFRDAEIKLKPLTVLLGPNSAGKSSFGHALAVMSHAHRIFAGTPQASLTPPANDAKNWPIDLGELNDLRTHGTEGPVQVELETSAGLVVCGFGSDSIPGLLPSYFSIPKGEESAGKQTRNQQVTVSDEKTGTSPIGSTGVSEEKRIEANLEPQRYEIRRINQSQWQEGGTTAVVILDGLLLRAVTHDAGTSRLLSGTAQDELKSLFEKLTYLRATRERPSRTYLQDLGKPQEIGYSGEWTATVLHRHAEQLVSYAKLPDVPNTLPEAQVQKNLKTIETSEALSASLEVWLAHLGLARSLKCEPVADKSGPLRILVTLRDQQAHNLIEIGLGMSQVLPVLIAGLLQSKESLFIVDLPEAHLHPRPQSDLADFFCSLALSGRSSLVETHSEMFFHRLRLRAEMDDQLKENIAVYFIDQPRDGYCQRPRPVGLTFDDQLRWPVGFLQETWELESQIEAVRQAKSSDKR